MDLPYKAEYAKTGRAGCKGCKTNIGQGSLRIAAMVQSAFHDGKTPNWFHEACFFKKQRPSTVGDIENFENLRIEDQERVQKKVAECSSAVLPSGSGKGTGKKRPRVDNAAYKDFAIEYAKSARAACRGCEQKIMKNDIRIRKTVYDTEIGMKYGGQALWHHIDCFTQLRSQLGWFDSGDNLPGFKSLNKEDQNSVKDKIPAMKVEEVSSKKPKLEPKDKEEEKEEKQLLDLIKKQTKRLFKFRDEVKDQLSKKEIAELLEYNCQKPISGDSEKLLDQVADLLVFGAIEPCSVCNGRQLLFHKSGYLCNGNLTEWTKCTNLVKEPVRKPCKVPSELKQKHSFLRSIPKKTENRAIRYIPPSATTVAKNVPVKKNEDEVDGPKVKRELPPLYDMQFAIVDLKDRQEDIKKRVRKLGGRVDSRINEKTMAIFSTEAEVKRMGSRMEKAKDLGLQIIPFEYLESVEANPANAINLIRTMSLCDWGTDPALRVPSNDTKSNKSKSIYTKSVPKSLTLKVKDGLAVDPDSGLEDVAHVYVNKKDKYSVVLGLTDVQRNKNSYYKLQLLESDKKNRYWLFRSWGRIGTTIGGNKLENFGNLLEARQSFEDLYLEKSGNHFADRDNFVKISGCMYPIDIDYDDKKVDLSADHHIKSKLHPSVQDLIKLIFDVDTMKRTMTEFHLDMDKMPLGKLSQHQIQSAYKVLTEVYNLIQGSGSNASFIDATNRFYTLIPHNFGVQSPPLLDTLEQVENLRQMLDSLLEIECAYNLLQHEDNTDTNPLDKHYKQLQTTLEPLDRNSEEFALLQKYVTNTHAETHRMYELEIVDIFKVARQGEARRYKPFKKLHNRKLLWHGSRLTNYAGILSHGLKIAPPEAPVSGYMFGKGIYFADMVSKSANYCYTNANNSTGLMLLSEVALGDMVECTQAKYITKLPRDKHSCLGRGRTMPEPKESYMREDGVEIPLGKPKTEADLISALLYNEYIVYDVAQVNIQYLLRMKFNYQY